MRTLTVDDPVARSEPFLAWLREHGIEPKDTYRVDIDAESVVAHQFDRDSDGEVYYDPATGGAAVRDPVTVPLRAPAPV